MRLCKFNQRHQLRKIGHKHFHTSTGSQPRTYAIPVPPVETNRAIKPQRGKQVILVGLSTQLKSTQRVHGTTVVLHDRMVESLSTGTFLHDCLFSVSGLDRERRFWREFLT